MSASKQTRDHKQIQKWVEARGGKPATVEGTQSTKGAGMLRIDFPGNASDKLKEISWDDFFDKFDRENIDFLYQEKTADGKESRFCKFVSSGSGD
jgi:hypothetical protein